MELMSLEKKVQEEIVMSGTIIIDARAHTGRAPPPAPLHSLP
jgi:hypothetical protein